MSVLRKIMRNHAEDIKRITGILADHNIFAQPYEIALIWTSHSHVFSEWPSIKGIPDETIWNLCRDSVYLPDPEPHLALKRRA